MSAKLSIKYDPETKGHRVYIDDEEVDFAVMDVQVNVDSKQAKVLLGIHLTSVDIDLENAELNIKVATPDEEQEPLS